MFSRDQTPDNAHIRALTNRIFPSDPIQVERITEGVSTYVYGIVFQRETFYLHVLPEEGDSFAPEVTVYLSLRQMQVRVPEVIYFEHYYEPLRMEILVRRIFFRKMGGTRESSTLEKFGARIAGMISDISICAMERGFLIAFYRLLFVDIVKSLRCRQIMNLLFVLPVF
jgi:hypothetical protein